MLWSHANRSRQSFLVFPLLVCSLAIYTQSPAAQAGDSPTESGATGPREVFVWPLAERPALDGFLNDAAWQGVSPLRLGYADVRVPGPAKMETNVWIGTRQDHLYVAFRCREGQRLKG
ncbi:hypothetical protein LCGC14_1594050, partial [marine sediment metagenome]